MLICGQWGGGRAAASRQTAMGGRPVGQVMRCLPRQVGVRREEQNPEEQRHLEPSTRWFASRLSQWACAGGAGRRCGCGRMRPLFSRRSGTLFIMQYGVVCHFDNTAYGVTSSTSTEMLCGSPNGEMDRGHADVRKSERQHGRLTRCVGTSRKPLAKQSRLSTWLRAEDLD